MLDKSLTPKVPRVDHIVVHWTAGAYKAGPKDRASYHILIEGDGNIVKGDHSISQIVPPMKAGAYAAHTKNLNSYSIGVSMCSMANAVESPLNVGTAPLKKIQWDTMIEVVAELCKIYNVKVSDKTVLSHAEVQKNLGVKQNGKWDIAVLPFDTSIKGASAIGDRMRKEIGAKLGQTVYATNTPPAPEKKVAAKTYSVQDVQQALINNGYKIKADGIVGPMTVAAIKMYQKVNGLNVTGSINDELTKALF